MNQNRQRQNYGAMRPERKVSVWGGGEEERKDSNRDRKTGRQGWHTQQGEDKHILRQRKAPRTTRPGRARDSGPLDTPEKFWSRVLNTKSHGP